MELEEAQETASSTRAHAPAEAITFVRSGGATALASTLLNAKKEGPGLSAARPRVRRFYKEQNRLISRLLSDRGQTNEYLMSHPLGGMQGETSDGNSAARANSSTGSDHRAVKLAVHGSFALNVLLLAGKLLAAIATGSLSVIAAAADSLLDLISGIVLTLTERGRQWLGLGRQTYCSVS
jgi:hypothetical protein